MAEIDDARRIPELVSQAFHRATSGRPGPVALALPEDMLTDVVEVRRCRALSPDPGRRPARTNMARLRELLAGAKRPLVILGGGGWYAKACADIAAFAEANNLPIANSFRCQDLLDNQHPNYVGDVGIGINPKLAERVRQADVLLVVGARLGEMTTGGYTLIDLPGAAADPGPCPSRRGGAGPRLSAGTGDQCRHGAVRRGGPRAGAGRFSGLAGSDQDGARRLSRLCASRRRARARCSSARSSPICASSCRRDAIITNGAGNYATWLHRFYSYGGFRTQLAPTSGAMGYGVPAAVAAKAVHPDRVVVSWNGDGCFMMNGQELATAVQYGLPIIFVVVNNGMYGTIRMHQERNYPERVLGTELVNPDFAALARAYGAHGELVVKTEEFAPIFERAMAAGKPTLIEIRIDPEVLTIRQTLSQIRAAALEAQAKAKPI